VTQPDVERCTSHDASAKPERLVWSRVYVSPALAWANPAPAGHGHKFETLRFLFGWDKYDEYWNLKSYAGCEGNILTIEDFLEARGVKQLVEDKTVCDSIVYYDWAGNEIDEATAFEWSKNMHPSKKPPSQRPGKRASSSPPGPSSGPGPSPGSPAKQPKA
jgi:hypothetical protein